jgi:hypothetical protein
MNRFCYSSSSTFPNIAFRSRKFSVFTARIRSDNRESPILFQPEEHTIDSLKQHKTCYEWPSKTGDLWSTIWRISVYKSDSAWFCSKSMQIAISLNDSKARSSGTEPRLHHGNFGDVQRGYRHSCKKPCNRSPELKVLTML